MDKLEKLCIGATHTEKQKKYLPQKVFENQKPVADFADKPLHDCRALFLVTFRSGSASIC